MSDFLVVKNVHKSFGQLKAVNDVSFSVTEGEIFGIAGPNGAGKTTLFNVISGIPFGPDQGMITLKGESIQNKPPHKIAQMGLMRTFQKETSFESLSVLDNVLVGAVYGGSRSDAESAAMQVLADVGLAGVATKSAGNLTLIEEKRLMFATAMVTKPKLLMLDEPAAGLNSVEVEEMVQLIRRVNQSGVTIILIEHVLPLLLALSERIMILNYGSKLMEGLPDDVVRDPRVIEAYLGKGEVAV